LKKAVRFVWYEWIIGLAALLLLILMVQTFIASMEAGEFRAGWMSIVFLGVLMFLIAVGTFRSVQARLKRGSVGKNSITSTQ
jgi:hypothetical protein